MGGLSHPVTAGQQREVVLTFLAITSKLAFAQPFTISKKKKKTIFQADQSAEPTPQVATEPLAEIGSKKSISALQNEHCEALVTTVSGLYEHSLHPL